MTCSPKTIFNLILQPNQLSQAVL